jgi:dihydropteroate synthase-like protein
MSRRIAFLTGHLAEARLRHVLVETAGDDFSWTVHDLGIQVAALMTADLIRRRLPEEARVADEIVVPGHCAADVAALSEELGVSLTRGPEDLHDLPEHFGKRARPVDLSRHDVRIFAEIVDAPHLSVAAILERAKSFAADGADVIDLGFLPDTPFPQMEEAIAALRGEGLSVSVDSLDAEELRRAGRARADFVLSLSEETLHLAEEMAAVPVLIPTTPADLDSLVRACERLERLGKPYIADAILEPLPFGFTASLLRFAELRRRLPEERILMGIGNLTELTDADSTGVNALLFGIIAELGITDVLAVQASRHCRTAIREADRSRRIMHAAKALQRLPMGIDGSLMALRDRKPFPTSDAEIAATAGQIRDANFRIEITESGIHLYNRDGHHVAQDAFALYPKLGVESDGAHAFYLGVELARAEIAWQLGKRYVQDEKLGWGCVVERAAADKTIHRAPGPTLAARRRREKR